MNTSGRLLIGIPAAALVAMVAIYDAGVGAANAEARNISAEVASWAFLASGPRADTASSLQTDLSRIAPRLPDPAYGEELAGVIAVRQGGNPEGIGDAKALFSKAVQGRPVSPYTWANIAHVDYELGRTGEEFERALRNAADLGPWEPAVQSTVVNYGLAVREEVTPHTRAVIDRVVSSAMRRNPLETLQIAERRGRLDIACQGLVNSAADTKKQFAQCGS